MVDLTDFGLSPAMLERLRQDRAVPTGGVWYWFPTPQGWDLAGFNAYGPLAQDSPPDEQAKVFHVQEFEAVVEMIAQAWRIVSLPLNREAYKGIPRGRVSRGADGIWNLEHGGEFATRHVKRLFGLRDQVVRESIIEHETTDPRHMEVIEQTLRYKTDDDIRVIRAFAALRDHRGVPTVKTTFSPSARASMAIEQENEARRSQL